MRRLSILRSNLRPINRLPPELLSHLFSFLGGSACVVPASHVCQQWRAVALSTPSLWATVREDDPLCAAQTFMERSGRTKLDISWPVYMLQDGIRGLQAALLPYAARIWRLHVVVYGERVSDFYRALATCDLFMPALEHFSLIMIEYGFPDDSHVDDALTLFAESEFLTTLTFRAALPLKHHLSPAIRSLTLADRVFDLDALLCCLASAPNLEYLALLDSVPHTFDASTRPELVSLHALKEFHWFQGRVFDNVLGTVKLFEHLVLPALSNPEFVLLLEPTKYAVEELYAPCERSTTLFSTITELTLEATHYAPGKPARNNIVFHGRHENETLFSVRVHRVSLDSLCTNGAILLTSSVRVDLSHLTHLTLTSERPYNWNRFFVRGGGGGCASWTRFFRCMPAVRVLRLYVSRPADIITALASADCTNSPLLAALRILHLFRCGGNTNPIDGDKVLMRFLKSRADIGIPIESIVCAAGQGNADEDSLFLPNVLSFVDEVEFAQPGSWADPPAFPRRMGALLEEHLN